jgi:AraC-like DNA-binding protein
MCSLHYHRKRNSANYASSNDVPSTRFAKHNVTCIDLNVDASARGAVQDIHVRKLLQLIEGEPVGTIHEWAQMLNLSDSHLRYLFKQATGMGLAQALSEKRLQRAAQLLASTNLRVKEVAVAVGYEHTSSFTRAFERRFEQGPRRYRLQNAA